METMPGGHYELCRWKVSSFWNHGMLLAVTVICVDLNRDFDDGLVGDCSELTDALRAAQRILLQSWSISADARKASTAIDVVLSKEGLVTKQNSAANSVLDQQAHNYFPQGTPLRSLEDFLGPDFPQFQPWVKSLLLFDQVKRLILR